MNTFIKIIFVAVIFLSCSQPAKEKEPTKTDTIPAVKKEDNKPVAVSDYFKVVGDSATIPSFDLEVQLSEKAEKKLKDKKESVIVMAYFSGTPKDSTKYMEDGEYAVGEHSIELTDSRIAKFSGIKISKKMYESLFDLNIELLINVYSGRRAYRDNILDVSTIQKPISEFKDQKFTVTGKLIGE